MRHRLAVAGVVQGVGFRPFVYALARRLGLAGSVANDSAGVVIEVEGPASVLRDFAARLRTEAPVLARIDQVTAADDRRPRRDRLRHPRLGRRCRAGR